MKSERLVTTSALNRHWRLFLVEGVVLVVLGATAVALPKFSSQALELFLGWLLLTAGGIGLATTLLIRNAPGYLWALASAVASIAAGAVLIVWPISSTISLTFFLAAFLVADGFLMIMFGIEHRRELSRRWGWLLVNGMLDLLLAIVIAIALPSSAVWALGLVVGIDMLFGGASLIAIALTARIK